MNETDALRALMEADRWIDRVTSQRGHLPEMNELTLLEEELRFLMQALHEAQSCLAPVQAEYETSKDEARRLSVRASDLDVRLGSSTATARELTAIQHELEHVRELLEVVEDRELELLVSLEPLEAAISGIKQRAQPGMARRGELRAIIEELQASLDEELEALRASRDERARALSHELASRYEHALARSGTSGAAQVDARRCDGCRIELAPLDFDRWKAQPASTFMDCPECGRLLLP